MAKAGKLKIIAGFVRETDIVLPTDAEYTIGRDRRRDLAIMSRKVSRRHATITCKNGTYVITDIDSKQGTIVNGKEVTSTNLRPNDIIEIGDLKAQFVIEEASPVAPRSRTAKHAVVSPKHAPEPKPKASVVIAPKPKRRPVIDETPSGVEITAPTFTEKERAMVGQTVGNIRIITTLNKGRRAIIYKGIHDAKNRVVAFKMLNEEAANTPDVRRWFIEGAQVAGKFRHEDAVSLLGGGRQDAIVFVFSRFMDGGNARDRFARAVEEGLPAVKRALETIVHVARALEYASNHEILHLGVRPSKILYDEERRAKLNGIGFDNSPTTPGAGGGPDQSVAFVAPELASGRKNITLAADIFSLGATFYYILTGRTPTRGYRQRIPSPKDTNQLVPDSICRIIEKMVNPAPERRYKSYGQLLHDVRWALRGEAWPHA